MNSPQTSQGCGKEIAFGVPCEENTLCDVCYAKAQEKKRFLQLIDEMIKTEEGCMEEDEYEEQKLEHQFALEPLYKLKQALKGKEKK